MCVLIKPVYYHNNFTIDFKSINAKKIICNLEVGLYLVELNTIGENRRILKGTTQQLSSHYLLWNEIMANSKFIFRLFITKSFPYFTCKNDPELKSL